MYVNMYFELMKAGRECRHKEEEYKNVIKAGRDLNSAGKGDGDECRDDGGGRMEES